jgi:hypothetical protein
VEFCLQALFLKSYFYLKMVPGGGFEPPTRVFSVAMV